MDGELPPAEMLLAVVLAAGVSSNGTDGSWEGVGDVFVVELLLVKAICSACGESLPGCSRALLEPGLLVCAGFGAARVSFIWYAVNMESVVCGIGLVAAFRCLLNWDLGGCVWIWVGLGEGDCLSGIEREDRDMLELACFILAVARPLMLFEEKVFL